MSSAPLSSMKFEDFGIEPSPPVPTPDKLGTEQVRQRVAARYAGNDYACMFEVPEGTGAAGGRSADAIVMNLWPSRGLEIEGFEFKVSRSDWVKELKDPSKADALQRYCDRWWVVVGDAKIVKPDELPSTWGLMVPHGDVLRVARQAPKLPTPEPVNRDFLAAMLRRASNPKWWQQERQRVRGEAFAEERGRHAKAIDEARKDGERRYTELRETVRIFEQASGLEIAKGWQHERIGQAVALLMETIMPGGYKPAPLAGIAQELSEMAERLKELHAFIASMQTLPEDNCITPPITKGA